MNDIIFEDVKNIVAESDLDWVVFAGKRVLITGASGFLPAYLVETLLYLNQSMNLNIYITALVRNKDNFTKRFRHHLNNPNMVVLVQDVADPISLDLPHHFIIHAASQASPKYYGVDPVGTLTANIFGTGHLLELARKHPIESFLYFSSGEVYGETKIFPTKESDYGNIDPTSIRSCYAESKRMGENMCISWYSQYDVPVKIVRPFHTYGPGMRLDDGRVYADFVRDVVEGNSIVMKSSGEATRAFCYLADATLGFLTVLLSGKNGVAYNVGNSNEEISILKLAHLLVDIFSERGLRVDECPRKVESKGYISSAISRSCPDTTLIEKLGWSSKTSLVRGMKRTVSSFEK